MNHTTDPHGHTSERDQFHFKETLSYLSSIKAHTVLDVGAWDGWLDFLLIEEGYEVTGIEPDNELAMAAYQYAVSHHIRYLMHACTVEQFEPRGMHFDCAIAYEILEHVDYTAVQHWILPKLMEVASHVIISLPDQQVNPQGLHKWVPSLESIHQLAGGREYGLTYKVYSDPTPASFIVTL